VVIFFTMLLPPILLRNSYLNDPSRVLPDYIRKEAPQIRKPSKKAQEEAKNGEY
jgi:hypothetical protein